jgi:hypothetical protein
MTGKYHGTHTKPAMLGADARPDRCGMARTGLLVALVAAISIGTASPAQADVTAFWGFAPKPDMHNARGFSLGISMLIVGFEGEYATLVEDSTKGAPGLRTGMINGMLQTPTNTQLYVTIGAGVYREDLDSVQETQFGTNIGGGIKIGIAGPLRLRIDYRVFTLHGAPVYRHPQRLYVGANIKF